MLRNFSVLSARGPFALLISGSHIRRRELAVVTLLDAEVFGYELCEHGRHIFHGLRIFFEFSDSQALNNWADDNRELCFGERFSILCCGNTSDFWESIHDRSKSRWTRNAVFQPKFRQRIDECGDVCVRDRKN